MIQDELRNEYYDWLYDVVCGERFAPGISYDKLLMYLHNTEFTYLLPMDENRANDGEKLRYRFGMSMGYDDIDEYFDEPCSVLEMMVALAIRCEEDITDDPMYGNRTRQWFWGMITNLGLGGMMDDQFDRRYVEEKVDIFLNREYEPNGRGGLFTVRNCEKDLRDVEIWVQMLWYLDSICDLDV